MVKEFLQYLQYEKNYSSHTVLSYHTDIDQFCLHLQIESADFQPSAITSTHIQQWILVLIEKGITARSLSRKISTLKSFWRFLQTREYTNSNPTLKIILPKTNKTIPAFFKENEMHNAISSEYTPENFTPIRDLLIINLFYQTGIRTGELISIEDKDIDLTEGSIRVIGKRNKQRIIPISTALCNQIKDYIQIRNKTINVSSPNLFLRDNGKKMYPKLVYNIVHTNMSAVSNLHKRSPHILRHTFATSMLNGGADINAVKELLGHSSLAATQIYTHTSFKELNNIYKHAHPRAK